MGKRLKSQRRGKGSSRYRATKNARAESKYFSVSEKEQQSVERAQVIDLVTDPIRTTVLQKILNEQGQETFVVAPEGVVVGQEIEIGRNASVAVGSIMALQDIPEGCPICNIELTPGDGGQLVRSSGSYGLIVTKDSKKAYVKMPSGKNKPISLNSRATIGCVACGGRKEKPFVKAGAKFHAMKAKSRLYPRLRGVAQNVRDHPFGGAQHHPGKSKSTRRGAAAGRKVGAIASKRTGRRKK